MDAGQWSRGKENTLLRYIIAEEEADYVYETSDLAPPLCEPQQELCQVSKNFANLADPPSKIITGSEEY